jgi:hypothetical protein
LAEIQEEKDEIVSQFKLLAEENLSLRKDFEVRAYSEAEGKEQLV